ncbi:MAG: carboxypeptidase regulatory-like domain-containing protein [Candidatus Magnetoovum sp. WYHC-5]|nr:carboxypeptidase regulatory-like domain-containing protein [Candidatus Magnetoovum sp. WYHC-5]
MKRVLLTLTLSVVLLIAIAATAYGYGISIQTATGWLTTNQGTDGSWYNAEVAVNSEYFSTTEVLYTLNELEETSSTTYQTGIEWLKAQENYFTEEGISQNAATLAYKLYLLAGTNADITEDTNTLISYANDDGGVGGYADYESSVIHATLTLKTLRHMNYASANLMDNALSFLVYSQNDDGGWGAYKGDDSSLFVTALVLKEIKDSSSSTTLQTAANKATAYLIANQNKDGGFGEDASTVYETALAYIALRGFTTDGTVLSKAETFITSNQQTDGSWGADPYITALAIRALKVAEEEPIPTPTPTSNTGSITGIVVNQETNQPLQGVTVYLQADTSVSTTTTSNGHFTLTGIPLGSQAIIVSLNGYTDTTINIDIANTAIYDVKEIYLSLNPTTGIIKGTLKDASSGATIDGVTITVGGAYSASAVTDSSGSFTISNVTPGTVTITASKGGYYTAEASSTLKAGSVLIFSPLLLKETPTTNTGSLTGKIVDAEKNTPIEGAYISLSTGITGTSAADGVFLISSIEAGTYTVTISKTGYISQSADVVVTIGTTQDMDTIYLMLAAQNALTVTGVVVDEETNTPIAGAKVSIASKETYTTTDLQGKYTLSGIELTDFTIRASAQGYNTKTYDLSTAGTGTVSVNISLLKSEVKNIKINTISLDEGAYNADETLSLSVGIENQGSSQVESQLMMEIQDETGDVIALVYVFDVSLPAGAITEGTLQWNTGQNKVGTYKAVLKVIEAGTVEYENQSGNLLAEGALPFTIKETMKLTGTISLMPSVTNVDLQEPVTINAAIRNIGSVNVATELSLEARYGDEVVYFASANINTLKINNIKTVDFGSFLPTESGQYTITISATNAVFKELPTQTLYVGSTIPYKC